MSRRVGVTSATARWAECRWWSNIHAAGRVQIRGRFLGIGQFGGVGAEEVVGGVPAGCGLGHEMGLEEFAEQLAGVREAESGETGGGGQGRVGARVQGEQPEEAGRVGGERVVGPGEHGPYVGCGIAVAEGRQPARVVA